MIISRLLKILLAGFISLSIAWIQPASAALPPGNAVKDPYAILRSSLPIDQEDLRDLQNKLENTSDYLRGKRWSSLEQIASSSNFRLTWSKQDILSSIPETKQKDAQITIDSLGKNLDLLNEKASNQDKLGFIDLRRQSLKNIGDLEAMTITGEFPYEIPTKFDNLPRLLGRANVSINTTKGKMRAIIDGYNAPLTGGAFIDLVQKGFYDGLPFIRAEDFYILQTGDPSGPEKGYIDPETKKERNVPLEIRVNGQVDTIYNETFEDLGLYTETPVLPFSTLGTLGWAHSDQILDDGSSQFFFFLYEAELNPAGKNLIDGRNAAFGYVIEGEEIINKLGVDDEIISIKIESGADRLQQHA